MNIVACFKRDMFMSIIKFDIHLFNNRWIITMVLKMIPRIPNMNSVLRLKEAGEDRKNGE